MKRKYDTSDTLNGVLFAPDGSWKPNASFPNLDSEKTLGIDIETRDPELHSRGPGFIRGNANVVGISITAASALRSWYFPIAHLGGGNLDAANVIAWLRDLARAKSDRYWIGANIGYELEGLDSLGISLQGRHIDVQLAEALLDEEKPHGSGYGLDDLCLKYLGRQKEETLLRQAADAYGVDPKSGLWKLHSKYVGPYAEFDSLCVLEIFKKQNEQLRVEGLLGIFELECKLIPLLWLMRKNGIPVDLDKARKLSDNLIAKENALKGKLEVEYATKIDPWSGPQLASLCQGLHINFPRTEKGNPSFTGEFLERSEHALLRGIAELRELNRLRNTFVDSWIFDNEIKGRIHPQWRQLASDEGGTRTGRMAASNPNPQQVPSRSELATLVREIFCAPAGEKWAKIDYSQQEPRLLVHFASLCKFTGAELIKMAYRKNKNMDIYQFLADSTGMSRRDSKDATLGRMYGMGAATFASKQGIDKSVALKKLEDFDRLVPFVKEIADSCSLNAQRRGYIKTLLGRRRHFNWWEPVEAFNMKREGHDVRPMQREQAEAKWGPRIQRAYTHKALNSLIQGSAADMTKAAMLAIWTEAKIIPYMQVHDELDFGVTHDDKAFECQKLAETCVELEVPIRADMHIGTHWK